MEILSSIVSGVISNLISGFIRDGIRQIGKSDFDRKLDRYLKEHFVIPKHEIGSYKNKITDQILKSELMSSSGNRYNLNRSLNQNEINQIIKSMFNKKSIYNNPDIVNYLKRKR